MAQRITRLTTDQKIAGSNPAWVVGSYFLFFLSCHVIKTVSNRRPPFVDNEQIDSAYQMRSRIVLLGTVSFCCRGASNRILSFSVSFLSWGPLPQQLSSGGAPSTKKERKKIEETHPAFPKDARFPIYVFFRCSFFPQSSSRHA